MTIKEFVQNKDVDYAKNPISECDIALMESFLEAEIGAQLKEYLLDYGYLGFGFVEFFGINNKLGPRSAMVVKTQYLHKYFPKTVGYIAFEDQGDGDFYIVDKDDNVYRFISSLDELNPINMKLFDYILDRFSVVE